MTPLGVRGGGERRTLLSWVRGGRDRSEVHARGLVITGDTHRGPPGKGCRPRSGMYAVYTLCWIVSSPDGGRLKRSREVPSRPEPSRAVPSRRTGAITSER